MPSFKKIVAVYAFALLLWTSQAIAGVTITPTTLLIEGRERYADVTLINQGNEPNAYEMGWKFFRQTEGTGIYENLERPTTEFDISQNIVFSPRRIVLVPHKAQKIRLALRLKGEPPAPGDYRGHFELREAGITSDIAAPQDGKSHVGVKIKVGVTIPVVYRVGESDATASIGNVQTRVNNRTGKIEAIVPLKKSKSAYGILGELNVLYKPKNGDEVNVGGIANANIFPEITTRTFNIPLRLKTLQGGTLRIVYKDSDQEKNLIYAERNVPIGQ